MAGRANCVACSQRVTAKQQSFRCGSCGKCVHTKCIAWTDQELQLLRTGKLPFHCNACWKATTPAIPEENTVPAVDAAASPPPRLAVENETLFPYPGDLGRQLGKMKDLLVSAVEGISFLTDEVSQLREENSRLRKETTRATEAQTAVIASLQSEVRALREELRQRGTPWKHPALFDPPAAQGSLSATTASSPKDQTSPSSFSDGASAWTPPRPDRLNKRQPRNRPLDASVGANENSELLTVPRQPPKKALFVSRLHPDTSVSTVTKLVMEVCKSESVVCTRLKTKYPSYASFHVAVSDECFALVNKSSVWPSGCLFRQFDGILREDRALKPTDINNA